MGTDRTATGAADPYAGLAAELSLLGRRLDWLGAELMRLRAADGSGAPGAEGFPGAPVSPAPPVPLGTGEPAPAGRVALRRVTQGGGPRAPRSQLSGARVLAWTGGGVTLLGVVLLLALAASRGWFSPLGRVTGGAVLGVALIGLALRLHRRVDARVGALAVAGTGFATLYLAVAAATALYGFLAPAPALLVALVVAAGGIGLADRWRTQLLGAGVVVGAAALAPLLAWGWLLGALVLALQLAALPVVLRRGWATLALLAAAGPALYGAAVGGLADAAGRAPAVAVAIGALAAGLATALPAARVLAARPVGALVAVAPVPVLVTSAAWGGWNGAAVAAVAVVGLAGFAAVPGTPRGIRVVAVAAAALALFQATLVALDGSTATVVLLGQAIVATVLAAQLRARLPLVIGAAYGGIGVLIALGRDAPLDGLVHHSSSAYVGHGTLVVGAAVSALVLVFAVALLVAGARVGLVRPDAGAAGLWAPAGVVGLYGASSLVVTLALLASDDRTGFTAGHALVTVSWTAVALVLLARGVRRPALRIAGMVLVAAAVAKLVLFDLVALDGLARVAAFLGAGLVLLAAGTRYARLVAEADRTKD
ncbi:DUF2339 domain-containing protein [Pseudonocardia adelaidensis]|uniref:Membrane protein DUF2339 n=1 Tax=Pseudonocardia adelaidensis TaxID=648754 RepID=A0ABP9NJX7_9PSEU